MKREVIARSTSYARNQRRQRRKRFRAINGTYVTITIYCTGCSSLLHDVLSYKKYRGWRVVPKKRAREKTNGSHVLAFVQLRVLSYLFCELAQLRGK